MDIFEAAKTGNLARVKQCVSEGVGINGVNSEGKTALYIASRYNNVNVVEFLLQKNADTEVREKECQWTALIVASSHNCRDVVKVLLQHGSDVNVHDISGQTPLWHSAYYGHQDTVQILLDHKASVDSRKYKTQTTPLYVAGQEGHVEVVRMLIRAGANLESRRKSDGTTPLIIAAMNSRSDVVTVFCQAGADVNVSSDYGNTALHKAAESAATDTVRTLLKYSPTLSKNKKGQTALDIAKEKEYSDIVTDIEHYAKAQQDKPAGGAVPKRLNRPQSGMRQYARTVQAELKEKKNEINQQRGGGSKYDSSVDDVEKELSKLLSRVEEAERNQGVSVQQGAIAEVKAELWKAIGKITKEMDELPDPEDPVKDLGNEHLFRIAKRVGGRWKQLGACLGREFQELERIQSENANDAVYSAWAMLVHWRDAKSGTADRKRELLIKAVKEVERIDLIPYI